MAESLIPNEKEWVRIYTNSGTRLVEGNTITLDEPLYPGRYIYYLKADWKWMPAVVGGNTSNTNPCLQIFIPNVGSGGFTMMRAILTATAIDSKTLKAAGCWTTAVTVSGVTHTAHTISTGVAILEVWRSKARLYQ